MDKKLRCINIISTIIIVVAFLMLVFCSFNMAVRLRLLCAVFLGIILGVVWLSQIYSRINIESKKIKFVEWINLILGLICLYFALPQNYVHFEKWLDNIFDKQLSYNVAEFFQNDEKTHYIFGFDITAYDNDPIKSPYIDENEDLVTLYKKYTSSESNTKVKYREFCRAKLCYDLRRFHKMDIYGDFSIYTIGMISERIAFGNLSKVDDVDNAILKLNEIQYNAQETHLRHYIETIHSIVEHEKKPTMNRFHKYVTFTYSDFVLDRNKKPIISDKNYISNLSKKELPSLSIINNLFISPCRDINNDSEFNIVKDFDDASFTKTKLDEITINTEFGESIHNLCERDTVCFFSEKEDVSPTFDLCDDIYSIRIRGRNDLDNKIILTNIHDKKNTFHLTSAKMQEIMPKGYYSMRFANSNVSDPVVLDIARKDIHCYLTLNTEKINHYKKIMRFGIILVLTFVSVGIPYFLHKTYIFLN